MFLIGCKSKAENIKPITNNVSFDCNITFYNEDYDCKVTNTKNNEITLKFSSPENINGLEYIITKDKITSVYKGIEYESRIESYPPQSIAKFIYTVLCSENNKVLEQNDNFFVEGKTKDYNYKMHLGQTGLPIKITEKNNSITVIIKNATILK